MNNDQALIEHAIAVDSRVRREQKNLRAREAELKAERAEAIRAALDGGVSATALAEAFGINRVTLYKLLRNHRNG